MAAELDMYALCPCGSGTKLKFCCAVIAPEMQKISRLLEDGQRALAQQKLEGLQTKADAQPRSRAWVLSRRAALRIEQGDFPGSLALVEQALESVPDHSTSLVYRALMLLQEKGRDAAWEACNAALEKWPPGDPLAVTWLLITLADSFREAEHFLAAEHVLRLAIVTSGNNEDVTRMYLRFVGEKSILLPLRSMYNLRGGAVPAEIESLHVKALSLLEHSALRQGGEKLDKLLQQHPRVSTLWFNRALCHAWSGEEVAAISAFRKLAELETDRELAVDAEVLAQALSHQFVDPQVEQQEGVFTLGSISRVLTALDAHPQLVRRPVPQAHPDSEDISPVAIYALLDHPVPETSSDSLESVSHQWSELRIFDANPESEEPAQGVLFALCPENLEKSFELIRGVCGADFVSREATSVVGHQSASLFALQQGHFFGENVSVRDRGALHQKLNQKLIADWLSLPLTALEGKTPQQAASVPELQRALSAAVVILELSLESRGMEVDSDLLRSRLGLPVPSAHNVSDDDHVSQLNPLELLRIPLLQLTDNQLDALLGACTAWKMRGLMRQVILERIARSNYQGKISLPAAYSLLAEISLERVRPEEALTWLGKARATAVAQKLSLNELFKLDMQELLLRREDPQDPELDKLAASIWNSYAHTSDKLRNMLATLLSEIHLSGPWQAGTPLAAAPSLGPTAPGGSALWTPEAAAPAPGGGKLWLPGQ